LFAKPGVAVHNEQSHQGEAVDEGG
jgi:hypothetical protein